MDGQSRWPTKGPPSIAVSRRTGQDVEEVISLVILKGFLPRVNFTVLAVELIIEGPVKKINVGAVNEVTRYTEETVV
ncbi:hypothetical protein DGG96_11925 [Legionella qingyii]|uniref:Uncharacterized protein n=1 Tax=Legionella qingyii TaxID=2184757 RepID=A0A317U520_9GAMM|nr:hypothetical protein DGG96_11925 [Legionella qingyii]